MFRLAYFVSHPIQYQAPLLRLIAADLEIELKVFFYSDFSLKPYQDSGFNRVIQWDIPLIDGYKYQFLKTWTIGKKKLSLQQSIAKDIKNQLSNGKYDAIWVHGWSMICGIQAILAAEQLGIPILMRGESNNLNKSNNKIKNKVKRIYLEWLFKKISGFLYIGTLNHRFYKDYGIEEDRLFSMPYAVDNDYYQNQAELVSNNRAKLKLSLNLNPNRPIILYAAKIYDVKRPQDLLAAYKLLSLDGVSEPEPYLLFVGDGSLRSEIERQAQEMNWHSILFLGFRNQLEMPAIYDLCDIFVLPSGFEPWGLAINEAMNMGKALVVSDQVGCSLDLIVEGVNGKIFPVADIEELAEALRWAVNHSNSAGKASLNLIQKFNYQEDIKGLKQALNYLKTSK